MTFQAKSTAAMLGILTVVYGCYFAIMLSVAGRTPVDQIVYQPLMILVTIPLVILAILVHIVIAIAAPSEADVSDERDRIITLRGEAFGGLVLGMGASAGWSSRCSASIRSGSLTRCSAASCSPRWPAP
jgi:hypothetical protein